MRKLLQTFKESPIGTPQRLGDIGRQQGGGGPPPPIPPPPNPLGGGPDPLSVFANMINPLMQRPPSGGHPQFGQGGVGSGRIPPPPPPMGAMPPPPQMMNMDYPPPEKRTRH